MLYHDKEQTGSGLPHGCLALRRVDSERLPGLRALAGMNGVYKFLTRTVQGSDGPEEVAYLIGDRYSLKTVAENALEKGYASYARMFDPREDEVSTKRLENYMS